MNKHIGKKKKKEQVKKTLGGLNGSFYFTYYVITGFNMFYKEGAR
ncbi:MAG TPA: hypothetical protein PKZ69_01260 [Candidatus Cloacimonadota bacterium]|nr:hypothetical protein [Candidatus Cloacimonadota bacterium]